MGATWTVIHRELLEQSRSRQGIWWRLLAPLALVGVLVVGLMNKTREGAEILGMLHDAGCHLLVLVILLTTSDVISRERREGTLGLLFLTPLGGWGILAGKLFAHLLRSTVVMASMLPIFMVPMLIGGANARDLWVRVWSLVLLMGMSLVGGIMGSALCTSRVSALVLGGLLTWVAFRILDLAFLWLWVVWGLNTSDLPEFSALIWNPAALVGVWMELVDLSSLNYEILLLPGSLQGDWLVEAFHLSGNSAGMPTNLTWVFVPTLTGLAALGSLIALLGMGIPFRRFGGTSLGRGGRSRFLGCFNRPLQSLEAFFKRVSQAQMNANPISWLQQRQVSGRMAPWIWVLIVLVFLVSQGTWIAYRNDFLTLFSFLALAMAAVAAVGFRKEREEGSLELLLCTPLPVTSMFLGKVRHVWNHFLGAVLLLLGAHFYTMGWEKFAPQAWAYVAFFWMPFLGVFASLKYSHILVATLVSWLMGLVFPLLLLAMMIRCMYVVSFPGRPWRGWFYSMNPLESSPVLAFAFIQTLVVLPVLWFLFSGRIQREHLLPKRYVP